MTAGVWRRQAPPAPPAPLVAAAPDVVPPPVTEPAPFTETTCDPTKPAAEQLPELAPPPKPPPPKLAVPRRHPEHFVMGKIAMPRTSPLP